MQWHGDQGKRMMIKFRKSAVKSNCGQTRPADCDTPHGDVMIGARSLIGV
jgi:hypothetical protein